MSTRPAHIIPARHVDALQFTSRPMFKSGYLSGRGEIRATRYLDRISRVSIGAGRAAIKRGLDEWTPP